MPKIILSSAIGEVRKGAVEFPSSALSTPLLFHFFAPGEEKTEAAGMDVYGPDNMAKTEMCSRGPFRYFHLTSAFPSRWHWVKFTFTRQKDHQLFKQEVGGANSGSTSPLPLDKAKSQQSDPGFCTSDSLPAKQGCLRSRFHRCEETP